ncbi:MAG TPA: zf-HC2 domain-containing protein [Isosphaeraceae bacterium]
MTPPGALWRLLHLPCREASRLASESLDRDLGAIDRLALRSHLLCCSACRRYRRQIGLLRDAMRRLAARAEADDDLPGPPLPDDVRNRIERTLKGR